MALSTYADLQATIANFLARDDLTAFIPDFISIFEAAANRRLRVREMEATALLTTAFGDATLPTNYLQWRKATWIGHPLRELEYVHPSWLSFNYPTSPAGPPNVFTIISEALRVRPYADATPIELLYYQRIPALASAVNWLYREHPDVYLFGSLAETGGFMADPNKLAMWKSRRDEVFQELELLSNKSRGVGGIRVMGATP